mmetsp:Transcript_19366/g.58277  ORF Transcript_19366/g.58277 Transcript_19366/m.58277 type:complete len:355 (-) Transcript_19366:99-1163(-)
MVRDELQFKVDQLAARLDEQNKRHAEALAKLRDEARQIKKSLCATFERARTKSAEEPSLGDDAFVRKVEWRIQNFSDIKETPKNEAIWSVEFSVMGVSGMQLEFFPQGRESTKFPGFCALFLWCPAGVRIRYRLRVGNHWSGPEEDEYESRMGHGHSNFCHISGQLDESSDSLIVGLEILSLYYQQEASLGIRLLNAGPEAMAQRELAVLQNRDMDCVEWRIKRIAQRAKEVPRGTAICSPLFSIAGVREMLMEFYPNGILPPPGAKEGREGFCGFYIRANGGHNRPGGPLSLQLSLFVGGAKKGPIITEFDGAVAKGLPEFCRLDEQIDGEDLIVGVQVVNPALQPEVKELSI